MRVTVYPLDRDGEHQSAYEAPVDALRDLLKREDVSLWVDMKGPSGDEIVVLQEVFGFHPLTVKQTYDERQRAKTEEYSDYVFMILNPVEAGGPRLSFRELDVFIGRNYVVSVHMGDEPTIVETQARIERLDSNTFVDAGLLLYTLLDTVVDGYFPILDGIGETIELIEQRILSNPGDSLTGEIVHVKHLLTDLWRVLWPQRDAIQSLMHADPAFLNRDTLRHHLRDVSDHLEWLTQMTDTFRDMMTNFTGLYMTAVSIRLNRTVSRLSVIAVIVGALTVVTAFYGMNFLNTWPPYGSSWSIVAVAGFMLVLSFMLYWFYGRNHE